MPINRADTGTPWTVDLLDTTNVPLGGTISLSAYITNRLDAATGAGTEATWLFNSDARVSMDFTCSSSVGGGDFHEVSEEFFLPIT